MFEKTGKSFDVQSLVEQPQIYIFARSNDSIADKLCYVDLRRADIKEMVVPIKVNDITLHDHMRFFQGK